ncbi:glycosyltransferase family A protein [Elizabethkingia sp. JS20170427COW]|uniref:glycosyltransferase family 2 protein n=1 Tax=Elizabethkingia sp. JS20170427COW TaxID=2583851 RepID=UPI0011106D15|nr:glycosyltransferase family A protein [Elizabethkingia sp. JS20170427COW]QCX53435.1 glycosyltransferase family 2 protein [Elizabethkingia sp. JS20170427COW]
MQPLISVIVPCYNQAQYLDECLQSVLDQTYPNWECIIVNDGSPDNTEEIAEQWTAKDSRFIYLKKENGGLSSARNAGIEIAKGEWILPLDCDDKIGNQYLELAEKEFDKGYTLIYCEAEFFGEKTGKWELPKFSLENLAKDNCIFCTALFKKEDWIKIGGYDEKMIYGLEDWEFWIHLLKSEKNEVYRISKILFYYRIKSQSMIKNLQNEKWHQMVFNIEKKHYDFFYSRYGHIHYLGIEKEKLIAQINKYQSTKRYQFIDKLFLIFGR